METNWELYWHEGLRYLEIAERAFPGKTTFTPEILYHMLGMSLEKMFMAWLGQTGNLPENHTVRDLVRAAELVEKLPDELRRDLIRFDRFMGLCSLEPVQMPPPSEKDVPDMLDIVRRSRAWMESRYMATIR